MLHHIPLRQKIIVMGAVMSGLFLVALNQTIITAALGQIVEDFNSFSSLGLVMTAYLLMNTVTIPIAGRFSDLFGRKPVLLTGVIIFTVASLFSGLAANFEQLILFRALQGVGGGIVIANAFTIIGDLFTPRERGRWQGIIGGIFGVAAVVGPLLGGFLTDEQTILGFTTNWRWTFFVNVPIGVAAGLLIARYCPAIKHDKKPVIDYAGAASITVALAAVVLAVDSTEAIFGGVIDQGVSLVIVRSALFIIAALAAALFVYAESRAEQPIIPLSFFKNRTFTSAMISSLLFGAAFLAAILYLTQFNQQVFGAGATAAGLMLLPMVGGMVLTSIAVGQMVSRTGFYKRYIVVGFSLATLGIGALSTLQPDTPYWYQAIIMAIVGIGLGAGAPIINLIVQNEFEQKDLGAATASSQLFRGLGSTIGVAVLSAILTSGVTAGIGDIGESSYVQAIRQVPVAVGATEGGIDSDVALQLNARSDEISEQALSAIDNSSLSSAAKETEKSNFLEAQNDFRRSVIEAFSDSLRTIFYISAGLMAAALVAISFIRSRELKSSRKEGPGVV